MTPIRGEGSPTGKPGARKCCMRVTTGVPPKATFRPPCGRGRSVASAADRFGRPVDDALTAGDPGDDRGVLDWQSGGRGIEWPTSTMVALAGYDDAFRRVHPCATSVPGHTWSPIISEADEPRDRIDYVFVRGAAALDACAATATPSAGAPIPALRQVGSASHQLGKHLENDWPTGATAR